MKNFDRVFYTSGDMNTYSVGKTFHDTGSTFDFSVHYKERNFHINETNGLITIEPREKMGDHYVYIQSSHVNLGHYRTQQSFPYKKIKFSTLLFDINYFKCYFLALLNLENKK